MLQPFEAASPDDRVAPGSSSDPAWSVTKRLPLVPEESDDGNAETARTPPDRSPDRPVYLQDLLQGSSGLYLERKSSLNTTFYLN